jgi:ATP-binding cassette subfamily B protein
MRANKEKSKSLVRRFVSYYGPYKWLFTADLFSAAINGGVGLVFPAMIRYIINDVFTMPDTSLIAPILTKLAILMFVLYLVEAGSLYFVSSWGHILGARIETDMRHDLFEHMEKLSFSFFDKTSTGKMVSRLISDLGDITELAHHGPENLFISAFKIVGSFIILSRIHFPMSMILLGFTILLVILMFGYRAKCSIQDIDQFIFFRHGIINLLPDCTALHFAERGLRLSSQASHTLARKRNPRQVTRFYVIPR